ncbi:MAG: hypothetical protein VCE12_20615 [Candidatus Latescibacterota bacterium]
MPDHPVCAYPQHYTSGDLAFGFDVRFEPADGGATVHLGRESPVAGTRGTWVFVVRNDHADLAAGSVLCVSRFDCQFAFEFQTDRPDRRDHATLESCSDAALRLLIGRESVGFCAVIVDKGVFARGDSFIVRLGDTRGGGCGSEVFWSATAGQLLLAIDATGAGSFVGAGAPLAFRVVHHAAPRLLRLLGPSVAAVNEAFDLHVGLFDRNGNPCEDFAGSINFTPEETVDGLPRRVELSSGDGGVKIVEGVRLRSAGVFRLRGTSGSLNAATNPILVENAPPRRVFWGDVHAHGWGDSTMHLMHLRSDRLDPAARHAQARRLGRLDFSCPAPMSMDPLHRDEIFGAYRAACAEHDEPGRYVPFLAYEAHPKAGDRQVIFRDYGDEATPPPMREPIETVVEHYGARDDVLLQVHIGGDPPHWDVYRPARERFLEVCSGFGCAEWLLQEALQLGFEPGVCAASDLHLGWMGGPRSVETFRGRFGQKYPLRQRDSAYGTGPITAIHAPELTRDSLWKAIEARHTAGTSGARMILDLRLGDAQAGDCVTVEAGDTLDLHFSVFACAPLARVDVIAGVHRLHTFAPGDTLDWSADLSLPSAEVPGRWIYLRVEQADGEWGWTSPVYLDRGDDPPAGDQYPAWNACAIEADTADPGDSGDAAMSQHLADLHAYLEREEEVGRFADLTIAGILHLGVGTCAQFRCHWGEEGLPMTIRWFYEFEIPKIRFDFGWRDYGAMPENQLGPQLMERY